MTEILTISKEDFLRSLGEFLPESINVPRNTRDLWEGISGYVPESSSEWLSVPKTKASTPSLPTTISSSTSSSENKKLTKAESNDLLDSLNEILSKKTVSKKLEERELHNKFADKSDMFAVEFKNAFKVGDTVDARKPVLNVEYRIGKLEPFVREAIVDLGASLQTVQLSDEQLTALKSDKTIQAKSRGVIGVNGETKEDSYSGKVRILGTTTIFSDQDWIVPHKSLTLLGRSVTERCTLIIVGPKASGPYPKGLAPGDIAILNLAKYEEEE